MDDHVGFFNLAGWQRAELLAVRWVSRRVHEVSCYTNSAEEEVSYQCARYITI